MSSVFMRYAGGQSTQRHFPVLLFKFFFDARSHYVALDGPELTIQTSLASDSEMHLVLPGECWD